MVKQRKIYFRQRVQHKRMTQQLFSAILRMDTEGYTAAQISEATGLTEHNINEYLAASRFHGTVSYPAVKDEVRRQHTAKASNDVSATSATSATGEADAFRAAIAPLTDTVDKLRTYLKALGIKATITFEPITL